jgi:hypothetical protein
MRSPEALVDLQNRFLAGVEEGAPGAEALVLPSATLDAGARLGIYQRMYWLRLRQVLAEDFEATAAVAGDDLFGRLVRGYLQRHRPRSFTLSDLGARFPAYLAQVRGRPDPLIDLAHLEQALALAAEAPVRPVLHRAALAAIDPRQWARLRLRPGTGLQLIVADYPVHAILDAVRAGREIGVVRRAPTFVVVWRRDFTVWRKPVPEAAFVLLAALAAGAPLEAAVQDAAAGWDGAPEALEQAVQAWFAEWIGEGLFSAAAI